MAIKQSRGITIGKGTPQRNEGQNGDITVRSLRKGLKMYVKQANVWHSVDLDIDLKQIATTVNNLERKVKELSTRRNNFPVVDKVMLKQAGGAAAVQIKNDAGAIAFRNSADSADISLKNPKIQGDIDGSESNPVINTESSNVVKMAFNDNSADFFVRLIGQGGAYDNAIQFWTGGTAKWVMGYTDNNPGSPNTTFRMNALSPNLDADVLQLTDAGALTVDGTVTANSVTLTGAPTRADIEGLSIRETGILETGSISTGFGAINNGSSNITTTGTVASGPSTSTSNTITGTTLISPGSNDRLIIATQTLNEGTGGLGTQEYRMIATNLTETATGGWDNVYLIDQQVTDSGGSTTSKFKVDNSGNATFAGTGSFTQLTSGAVIWQYFPFITQLMTSARGHYFRDVDDTASPHEKWDTYDTDMVLDYRALYGFFCVPENCTLVAWHGKVANSAATANPTISVYHATPETDTSNTTFALAGSASVVSIGTARVAHDYSGTCDVDLAAGDLVVPTIKHSDGSSQGYCGSITLKFITR